MPKLSVIVPVYRAEKYLEKCVRSIRDQTMPDLEIILVEDGSPDQSPALCDRLAGEDSRIRVIHQENAGVSAARNRGIREARGDYVGFVDSDDWILENMYEVLLNAARESGAEVVSCDGMYVWEDGRQQPDTVTQLPQSCILTHEQMDAKLLTEYACSACYRIYSRKLLECRSLQFPEKIRFSEDRIFNL